MFKRALTKYKFVFSSDNTHQIMFPVTDTPTRFKQISSKPGICTHQRDEK